jgi:hypothetical protein
MDQPKNHGAPSTTMLAPTPTHQLQVFPQGMQEWMAQQHGGDQNLTWQPCHLWHQLILAWRKYLGPSIMSSAEVNQACQRPLVARRVCQFK